MMTYARVLVKAQIHGSQEHEITHQRGAQLQQQNMYLCK